MGSKESFQEVQADKMEESKKLGYLSWKKVEGVGDTIVKLKGNMEFKSYIREKYGDCDGARIFFCYRAVTPLQLNQFLKGPMSEKERDSLFLPTKNSVGQGYYFSIDPRREARYCSNKGTKILVKVTIYFKEEDCFLENSEFCLQSTTDCYPTHIIYLHQTSRISPGKNIGYKVLRIVSNLFKSNIPDEKIEREPESESEPEKIKVIEPRNPESEESKVVEPRNPESEESKVVEPRNPESEESKVVEPRNPESEESKVVEPRNPESEEIKIIESKKPEPKQIKLVEPKKSEAEESKVVEPTKHNYVSQKNLVSKGEHPVWSVKVKGVEMMEYSRKQSEEIENIYQRWQQWPNTQNWTNNKGKLSKEGEWTYEISFNEYNPNSWTQENTTTKKKRSIRRNIMCQLVDAGNVPPLPYSWSFKEQEGVYIEYYHIHQIEIEDIFQRWRAGGCGKGNLSRDMGGNVRQNYVVEFASSHKSTWKQWNLDTKYSRCLRREPAIDISLIDKEPNVQLLRAPSLEFKEIRDQFVSAQTHGDFMEVGSIWKIKKTGDIAFMEKLRSLTLNGNSNANIKTLYHGTTEKNIKSIVNTGFLKSNGGMLGSGVYLAPDPGKTKYYSKDNQDFLLIAIVNLKGSEYSQNKIYDEYCVPIETLAVSTHIIRYNIKCQLCGLFINNGDTERSQVGGVHIVHTSCWQKRDNFIRCAHISSSGWQKILKS